MPPAPSGERYEDLIEVFTVLSRTLAEDESVHDTLQSILTLALRLGPGLHRGERDRAGRAGPAGHDRRHR